MYYSYDQRKTNKNYHFLCYLGEQKKIIWLLKVRQISFIYMEISN